ncbi:MAG: nuclear transport factor 2 family protein [Armatimonadetes bacterium]|nr:nuclear transport factor 2 family protein [Armatimonadota bacterium]
MIRLALLLLLLLASGLPLPAQVMNMDPGGGPTVQKQVADAIMASAEAWNRGDLERFLEDYLKSEDMTFTSGGRVFRGYQALKDRYQQTYGNDRASMGQLSFADIEVWPLGDDHALALGKWHLERQGQETLDGIFSLVMQKTREGWRILHDHTSRLQEEKS